MSLKRVDEFVMVPQHMYETLVKLGKSQGGEDDGDKGGGVSSDTSAPAKPATPAVKPDPAPSQIEPAQTFDQDSHRQDSHRQDSHKWTSSYVTGLLPKTLQSRGGRLLHILSIVVKWNQSGEVIDHRTGSVISGSHIVDLIRHLLQPLRRGGDPHGMEYMREVVDELHVPQTLLHKAGQRKKTDRGESDPPPKKRKASPKKPNPSQAHDGWISLDVK